MFDILSRLITFLKIPVAVFYSGYVSWHLPNFEGFESNILTFELFKYEFSVYISLFVDKTGLKFSTFNTRKNSSVKNSKGRTRKNKSMNLLFYCKITLLHIVLYCSKCKSVLENFGISKQKLIEKVILVAIHLLKVNNRHKMFKVNNKNTRMISLALLCLLLGWHTYDVHFEGVGGKAKITIAW